MTPLTKIVYILKFQIIATNSIENIFKTGKLVNEVNLAKISGMKKFSFALLAILCCFNILCFTLLN